MARRARELVVLLLDDELRRVVAFWPVARVEARRVGALAAGAAAGAACGVCSWCSRDIRRDLRRAAALRWTMPLWAALSRARTAARTLSAASAAVLATASVAVFT